MKRLRATTLGRWALALALLTLGAPAAASAATGTYAVKTCAASSSSGSNGWASFVRPGEPVEASSYCYGTSLSGANDGAISFANSQLIRPTLPHQLGTPTTATAGIVASLTLAAPAGSTLTKITYHRALQSTDPAWDVSLSAGSQIIDDCRAQAANTPCVDTAPGGVVTKDLPAGTTSLVLAATCVDAPCAYPTGSTYTFGAAIYSATVTVADTTAPTISALDPGRLTNGWVNASGALTVSATDAAGIADLQLLENGKVVTTASPTNCVDWSPLPCADPRYGETTTTKHVFTPTDLKLSDGPHTLVARATDPAGNTVDSAPVTIKLDKTAPTPTLTGGGDDSAAQREIGWDVPAGGSPLTAASVEVCMVDELVGVPSGCVTSDAAPAGPFTVTFPSVLSDAEIHVTLTDEAGNRDESDALYIGRDAVPPKTPTIAPFGVSSDKRTFVIVTDDESTFYYRPRLCQGSSCTTLPDVIVLGPSTTFSVTPPGPGDYRLEVVAGDILDNLSPAATATFTVSAAAKLNVLGAGTGTTIGKNGLSGQVITIAPIVPKKLSGSTLLIRGVATPGSASSIAISLAGRLKNGKATGAAKSVVPAANGKFAVRLRLPSKLNRSKGVLVTIAATPEAGYAQAKTRVRVKG